jgi:hypothetical protein
MRIIGLEPDTTILTFKDVKIGTVFTHTIEGKSDVYLKTNKIEYVNAVDLGRCLLASFNDDVIVTKVYPNANVVLNPLF